MITLRIWDTIAFQKGTLIYINPVEPPYTERYVRWCERSAAQIMGSLLLD